MTTAATRPVAYAVTRGRARGKQTQQPPIRSSRRAVATSTARIRAPHQDADPWIGPQPRPVAWRQDDPRWPDQLARWLKVVLEDRYDECGCRL